MRAIVALVCVTIPSIMLAQTSPIDIQYARSYFAELDQLGRADGGSLWGRSLNGPVLFVDPVTRTLVANMPDLEGLLRPTGGVWTGILPTAMNVANTATEMGGRRWSMVIWPVSDSRYSRRRLLLHESFHRIQNELGIGSPDRANAHLGTVDGRIWTKLEWRALTEALLRTGIQRKEALQDALTFRARRQSLSDDAAEEERLLELNEGLAEYTGFALSGLPRSALYDRVAVQLAQYEQQENFARSFAYASGPAYAILLDASGMRWRKQINAKSDLPAMAAKAFRITRINPKDADQLSQRYTAARMIADERAREVKRTQTEAEFRLRLIDGPTVTIAIARSFSFSFDPNGATPLQNTGTVYETSRITDDWGILEVTSGGVLMRRTDGTIKSVVVPSPITNVPPVNGRGWRLTLSPGWSLRSGVRQGDWTVMRDNP